MTAVSPTPAIRLDMLFQVGDEAKPTACRTFWAFSGAATATNLNNFLSAVGDGYITGTKPLLQADNSLAGLTMQDMSSDMGAVAEALFSVTGTLAGGPISAATATLLNFTVGRHYRGGKPRLYLPWGSADSLDTPDAWTSGYIEAATTAWGNWVSQLLAEVTGGFSLTKQIAVGYYSGYTLGPPLAGGFRKRIPTPRAVPLQQDITGTNVNPKPAQQRRRLGKR